MSSMSGAPSDKSLQKAWQCLHLLTQKLGPTDSDKVVETLYDKYSGNLRSNFVRDILPLIEVVVSEKQKLVPDLSRWKQKRFNKWQENNRNHNYRDRMHPYASIKPYLTRGKYKETRGKELFIDRNKLTAIWSTEQSTLTKNLRMAADKLFISKLAKNEYFQEHLLSHFKNYVIHFNANDSIESTIRTILGTKYAELLVEERVWRELHDKKQQDMRFPQREVFLSLMRGYAKLLSLWKQEFRGMEIEGFSSSITSTTPIRWDTTHTTVQNYNNRIGTARK